MELVVLGSGGWIPTRGRHTTCVAVRSAHDLLLLDAGTGVGRLLEPSFSHLLPEGDGAIHIILTHLHLDHTVGLSYLSALPGSGPITVYLPEIHVEMWGEDVLDRVVGPPFFPHTLAQSRRAPELHTLASGNGNPEEVAGLEIRVLEQMHPGSSLSVRIGDAVGFVTDAVFAPSTVDFVAGVEVLLHEAWSPLPEANPTSHSSGNEAGRLAWEAGVGELLLLHLRPDQGDDWQGKVIQEARAAFENSHLCADGLSRSVGPR